MSIFEEYGAFKQKVELMVLLVCKLNKMWK